MKRYEKNANQSAGKECTNGKKLCAMWYIKYHSMESEGLPI